MSQRLRGEPSRKSKAPRVLVGIAAAAGALLLAIVLIGGDEDTESVAGAENKIAAAKPTPEEVERSEERDRRKRAKDGRIGVFDGAGPGRQEFGKEGLTTTYSVATEEATGVRPRDFAADVDQALGDPRSWTAEGTVKFERVEDRTAAVRIVLGTPATVDELCLPLDTIGQFSCREGGQLNINLDRWLNGTDAWPLSVDAYRDHVINHEMGHFLGYDHLYCEAPGALAPVMMQQTKGLEGCKANEWPFPAGSADASRR